MDTSTVEAISKREAIRKFLPPHVRGWGATL
jgi:hypothetical protein